MNDYIFQIYNKTSLKILSYIAMHNKEDLLAKEVQDKFRLSKGSINQHLKFLLNFDLIKRIKRANLFLYSANNESIILRQFKIFETLLILKDLIKELGPYSYRIILFGSCATGTNVEDSDIDLFIHTESVEKTQKICNKYSYKIISLRPIIQDTLALTITKKQDKAFYEQVKQGIILLEGEPLHE